MKHYLLEPTYKKSVIEWTIFRRMDENNKPIFLRKELGWRWGSWLISVPETEEEAMEYIKSQDYDNALDWAYDYGYTVTDDNGDEVLDPDTSLVDMVATQLLPNEEDESVDITEDYGDAEMIECWDGCWEYWSVDSYLVELDEEDKETWIEEAEEAYEEMHEEGVESLGWEFIDTMFEFHCSPKITPCDEHGKIFEESED